MCSTTASKSKDWIDYETTRPADGQRVEWRAIREGETGFGVYRASVDGIDYPQYVLEPDQWRPAPEGEHEAAELAPTVESIDDLAFLDTPEPEQPRQSPYEPLNWKRWECEQPELGQQIDYRYDERISEYEYATAALRASGDEWMLLEGDPKVTVADEWRYTLSPEWKRLEDALNHYDWACEDGAMTEADARINGDGWDLLPDVRAARERIAASKRDLQAAKDALGIKDPEPRKVEPIDPDSLPF